MTTAAIHKKAETPATTEVSASHTPVIEGNFGLTQAHDAEGRGVTCSYLCALTSGREYPSRRSLELIAASLKLEPRYFPEYRLAELRDQLDPIRAGFNAAWRHYLALVPQGAAHSSTGSNPTALRRSSGLGRV